MQLPALRSPSFRLYEGGSVFALNGQWITRIVVGWVGWELTGSATWVGLLSFFLFAPAILSGPLFGVLMDRVRLRPAAIVSHGIITAATFVMFLLYVGGLLTILSLSAVTLVIGIAASAERSTRVTIVPRMVEVGVLPNAVAIHATNFNLARLIGPAVGGLLLDRFGTATTMLVNVIVLVPFLVILFFLEVRENQPGAAHRPFLAELWAGARYAALHPVIRDAMLYTLLTSLTVRGVLEILPALADGVFHRGAEGLGQMVAAGGAGALVAAVTVALRPVARWDAGIPLVGRIAVFVGLLSVAALGLASTWPVAILIVAVTGFCGTMIGINMQSAIQLTVEDGYRARVMSLWTVTGIGMSAIGALILGSLADLFGLSETLVGGGLVSAALILAIRFALGRASRAGGAGS